MPRNGGMETASSSLKRKRQSSEDSSNIENEPYHDDKRHKEGDSTTSDERLPLSELSILGLSATSADFSDVERCDTSGSDSLDHSSPTIGENSVSNTFIFKGETSSPGCDLRSGSLTNRSSVGENSVTNNGILKGETSSANTPRLNNDHCKILFRWPTLLRNVNWDKPKKLPQYLCLDSKSVITNIANLFDYHPGLLPRMRSVLMEWLIEVCDVFKLHRETYYLTVDYIDRFLYCSSNVPKAKLQLIGVSCLLIACKIEEIYPPKVSELAFVTDGSCTEIDILTMEVNIIKVLQWKLKCITPNCWLLIYLQLGYLSFKKETTLDLLYPLYPPELYCLAAQLLDLVTLDISSLHFKPSTLAISVLHIVSAGKFPLNVSDYCFKDIESCVNWMEGFWCALLDKRRYDDPDFQPYFAPPPKRIVTDLSHFIQTNNISLELLELGQKHAERLTQPLPSSLNLLTPPSSSKKN